MSFYGKVAIVAGAGAKVAPADLKEQPGDIAAGPGAGAYHQGDVTDEAFVRRVVAETVTAHGRLDYLVNTTGVLWFDRDRSLVDGGRASSRDRTHGARPALPELLPGRARRRRGRRACRFPGIGRAAPSSRSRS